MAVHQLPRPLIVAALAATLAGAAACSSSSGQPRPVSPSGTSHTASTVHVAKPSDTGFIGSANSAECATESKTLEAAVEAYTALNGQAPSSEADLVKAGLIREPSKLFDLGPGGSVVPAATSACH